MLQPGDTLDLSIPITLVTRDGDTRPGTLADIVDGPTVLSVYMKNNTASCDRQMLGLADAYDAITARGFAVVGISKDSPGAHARYIEKHGLPFALVSDPDHRVSAAADAIVEKKMRGKTYNGPARAAYVVNGVGTVQAVIEKVDTKAHGAQVLAILDELASR